MTFTFAPSDGGLRGCAVALGSAELRMWEDGVDRSSVGLWGRALVLLVELPLGLG